MLCTGSSANGGNFRGAWKLTKKIINALLWRSYLTSTSDALWGERSSQYYIDLPRSDFENFFGQSVSKEVDKDKNEIFTITLEPFEGVPSAEKYDLTFKKLRAGTEREGTWNINDQFTDRAYDLWQQNRGPLKTFSSMDSEERKRNYIVIFRDLDGHFHGRWVQASDFVLLPDEVQQVMTKTTAGWRSL